ncbi:MAG: methionyl-tRNA formyltransferase, partial [Gammaproteobacteria bacterium]|nr:methionyl-tRNA formyltransferase [Gammaproteobacteria bacterium]
MKIVFIGAVEFSQRTLEKLIEMEADIVGVCTMETSTFNADHRDISKASSAKNIPWKYISDINSDESVKWIVEKKPDVIFCFGWSRLLGEAVLNIAHLGVLGFHP